MAPSASCENTGVHRCGSWVYPGSGWALHPEAAKYSTGLCQCLVGLSPVSFCSWATPEGEALLSPSACCSTQKWWVCSEPGQVKAFQRCIANFNISPDLQGGDILPFGNEQLSNFKKTLSTPEREGNIKINRYKICKKHVKKHVKIRVNNISILTLGVLLNSEFFSERPICSCSHKHHVLTRLNSETFNSFFWG